MSRTAAIGITQLREQHGAKSLPWAIGTALGFNTSAHVVALAFDPHIATVRDAWRRDTAFVDDLAAFVAWRDLRCVLSRYANSEKTFYELASISHIMFPPSARAQEHINDFSELMRVGANNWERIGHWGAAPGSSNEANAYLYEVNAILNGPWIAPVPLLEDIVLASSLAKTFQEALVEGIEIFRGNR